MWLRMPSACVNVGQVKLNRYWVNQIPKTKIVLNLVGNSLYSVISIPVMTRNPLSANAVLDMNDTFLNRSSVILSADKHFHQNNMEHFERRTDSFLDFVYFQVKILLQILGPNEWFANGSIARELFFAWFLIGFRCGVEGASRVGAVDMTHYTIRHTLGQLPDKLASNGKFPPSQWLHVSIESSRSRLKLNSIEFRWKIVRELPPFAEWLPKVVCAVRANTYLFIFSCTYFHLLRGLSARRTECVTEMAENSYGCCSVAPTPNRTTIEFLSLIAND